MGYDASPESARALAAARELAAAHAGTVNAVRVVSLQEVREDKPIPADWPDAIEELIEGHSRELAQLQGVVGVVTYGGPREELVQAGKELDLLIVGSRGYGPIGRLFHGSVFRYLVGRATCPLLVLPRQAVTEREYVGDGRLVPRPPLPVEAALGAATSFGFAAPSEQGGLRASRQRTRGVGSTDDGDGELGPIRVREVLARPEA